jgi:acyl carrier protein
MPTEAVSITAMQRLITQVRGEEAPQLSEVTRDTRFVSDLGFASLELIGLVFLCEQTFEVALVSQPGLLAKLQTIGEAVDAIGELQRAGSA